VGALAVWDRVFRSRQLERRTVKLLQLALFLLKVFSIIPDLLISQNWKG